MIALFISGDNVHIAVRMNLPLLFAIIQQMGGFDANLHYHRLKPIQISKLLLKSLQENLLSLNSKSLL